MYSYFGIPFNTMRVLDMSWVVIGGRCVWGGEGGQDMISIVSPTTPLATTPACGARKKKSGKITRNRKMFVELSHIMHFYHFHSALPDGPSGIGLTNCV